MRMGVFSRVTHPPEAGPETRSRANQTRVSTKSTWVSTASGTSFRPVVEQLGDANPALRFFPGREIELGLYALSWDVAGQLPINACRALGGANKDRRLNTRLC